MGLACAIPHLSRRCNLILSLKKDVIWILLVMTWTWLHTRAWFLSIIASSQGESDACSVLHALTHFSAQFQIKLMLCFLKLKTNTLHMILSNCSPLLCYTFKIFLKVKIICVCGFVHVRKTSLPRLVRECKIFKKLISSNKRIFGTHNYGL